MKEKTKGILLASLVVVAALIWHFERRVESGDVTSSLIGELAYKPLAVENPALQREKQEASRKSEYKSAGRDLFSEIAPPPPESVKKAEHQGPVGPTIAPPPPPPALPGNMKFFGYGTVPNGSAKRAFLSDGEQVYIVAEGDTLLGKYRVVRIGNANLDFEEIASGRRGSTALTDEPVTAPAS
jgi:hypothetical protein